MSEQQYIEMTSWIRKSVRREKIFCTLYYYFPSAVIIIYVVTLIYQMWEGKMFWEFACGPAVALVVVTALRKSIDKPRPYVIYDFYPVILKKKQGESFPSRHAVSASAIAVPFFFYNIWMFIGMCVLALLVGATRILAGVHFVKDVMAGYLIGFGISFAITALIIM